MHTLEFKNTNSEYKTTVYNVKRKIEKGQSELNEKHLVELVTSSPSGRKLLTDSFVIGEEYRKSWSGLISESIASIPELKEHLLSIKNTQFTNVALLTGGHDCRTDQAISKVAPHLKLTHELQINSKRRKLGSDNDWTTKSGGIKGKLSYAYPRTVIISDINATGATMKRALATTALMSIDSNLFKEISYKIGTKDPEQDSAEALIQAIIGRISDKDFVREFKQAIEKCESNSGIKKIKPIDTVIIVNVGSDLAADYSAEYLPLFVALNPNFKKFYVIHSETIAEVAWKNTNLPVKNPGTSLLWRGGPTPEYLINFMKRDDPFPWEDCIIYYGSKRSREAEGHLVEPIESLTALAKIFEMTNEEYSKKEHVKRIGISLLENFEITKEDFIIEAQKYYLNTPNEIIEEMFEAFDNYRKSINLNESLKIYCKRKIESICERFSEYPLKAAAYLLSHEKYEIDLFEKPDATKEEWGEMRETMKKTLAKKVRLEYR